MRGSTQRVLRRLTRLTRPLALRSAGKPGSSNSVVRHVGRVSGHTYDTPVVAAEHDESVVIALPYGDRTDWVKNVVAAGSATLVTAGHSHRIDEPQIVPMAGVTEYFQPKEQRLHRRFKVDHALQARQGPEPG